MVPERNLFAARRERRLVQRPPAHFRAQRAGVRLLADIENNLFDLGRHAAVWNAKPVAEILHRAEIHPVIAHFQRDGSQFKGFWVKFAQICKRRKQRKRILAARHPNGNMVAGLDHVIMVDGAADIGKQFLHNGLL